MVHALPKLSFFLLILSFIILTMGIGYLTGISVRYFALTTKDHFIAFAKDVVNFFEVFWT